MKAKCKICGKDIIITGKRGMSRGTCGLHTKDKDKRKNDDHFRVLSSIRSMRMDVRLIYNWSYLL